MAQFRFDHVHLMSRDPEGIAQYYQKMFDAKIIESTQSDGKKRIDLEIGGLTIFILRVPPDEKVPESPPDRYLGLDHFGFAVDNLEEIAGELKKKGAEFAVEPKGIRPGVKIAYLRAPENVRIELVERG